MIAAPSQPQNDCIAVAVDSACSDRMQVALLLLATNSCLVQVTRKRQPISASQRTCLHFPSIFLTCMPLRTESEPSSTTAPRNFLPCLMERNLLRQPQPPQQQQLQRQEPQQQRQQHLAPQLLQLQPQLLSQQAHSTLPSRGCLPRRLSPQTNIIRPAAAALAEAIAPAAARRPCIPEWLPC